MTPDRFRELALELPEALEGSHHDHPDFRVRGKVFATLAPDGSWGMVKLPVPLQEERVRAAPDVFEPVPGAWGRQGCTRIHLRKARVGAVRSALAEAWRKNAPRRLVQEHNPADD